MSGFYIEQDLHIDVPHGKMLTTLGARAVSFAAPNL